MYRLKSLPRIAAAAIALALLGVPAQAGADDEECRAIHGPFTSTLIPPPTCTSPVGLCTHGLLRGNFAGTYDFTFMTLSPVNDPAHPGRFFYTGTSVITPAHGRGQLFSEDHGYLDMNPGGLSPFVTTVQIVRGTGRRAETGGVIVASGSLDLITGDATGSFTGALCRDDDE